MNAIGTAISKGKGTIAVLKSEMNKLASELSEYETFLGRLSLHPPLTPSVRGIVADG